MNSFQEWKMSSRIESGGVDWKGARVSMGRIYSYWRRSQKFLALKFLVDLAESEEKQIPENLKNANVLRKTAVDSIHSFFFLSLDHFQLATNHVSCCVNTLVRSSCAIPPILCKISSTRFLKYFHKSILVVKVRIRYYTGFV